VLADDEAKRHNVSYAAHPRQSGLGACRGQNLTTWSDSLLGAAAIKGHHEFAGAGGSMSEIDHVCIQDDAV